MHAELMAPRLLAEGARRPALELLLARARVERVDREDAASWLAHAFGLETVPAGALTASAPGFWVRADPVHYRLLRDRIVLVPLAGLDAAYASALVATLNRHFEGRYAFVAPHPDAWAMRAAPAALDTAPTSEVAGADVGAILPGAPWAALLNEIQMALHEHPASEGRELEVNGVWVWGAGELPGKLAAPWRSVAADDPLALGLARAAGIKHGAPPAAAPAWLDALPGEGRHLVVPGVADEDADASWFAPLLAALRQGRVGMVTLHAPEAGLSFEVTRSDLYRFWRRARPAAEHAPR
ncbi:MAG: hypothetical protein ACREVQ_15890 [Burkholderiales bacterium]